MIRSTRTPTITAATVIHPGDTLTLPAGARITPVAAAWSAIAPRPAGANVPTPGAPTAGATSYTVRSGESAHQCACHHIGNKPAIAVKQYYTGAGTFLGVM